MWENEESGSRSLKQLQKEHSDTTAHFLYTMATWEILYHNKDWGRFASRRRIRFEKGRVVQCTLTFSFKVTR